MGKKQPRIILPPSLDSSELETRSSNGWKDHPIVVASISVAATIGLALLIMKEVILPTQTASLTNQITTLTKEAAEHKREKSAAEAKIRSLEARIRELESQLRNTHSKVGEAETRLRAAQFANLFSSGSPYPLGLGQVRIGDPISKVAEVYAEKSIEREREGSWEVKGQHKVFPDVTYYFDENTKVITHISFRMDFMRRMGDEFLQQKLVESLGAPKNWSRKNYFSWSPGNKVTVFKSDNDGFLLMSGDYRPVYWPNK